MGHRSPPLPSPSADSAAVIVVLLDSQGVVRSVTATITTVAGYPVEDVLGRPAVEFIHSDDVATWAKALDAALETGAERLLECRLRHRDGEWIPMELLGVSRLHDPMASALVVTMRNRTASAGAADRLNRLTVAIEQGPAAVLITDLNGRIEYVNPVFTELTGYPAEEALGQTPSILKSGLTPAEVYQKLWTTIRSGAIWRGELCNRRKDGQLYWHSTSISPVRDSAGRVSGFVAVQEDITERRRTIEALAASERDYRRIVDTSTEGIWAVDAEHRTTFVNQRLASLLGFTEAEMIGRPVLDFTDEEGRVLAEASLARRRQGIREQLDFKLRRRDGSTLWVLMSTGPILDDQGRYVGALAMVTDMTERREAEAALRGSEAWFRTLIEQAQELTSVVAANGAYKYASPSFESILGHRPSDLIGRTAFEFVHPDDLETVVKMFEEGVPQPGAVRALQFRFRHQDGTWRIIDALGRNLLHDPVIAGVVLNGRDVTQRVALEAQYRQAQKMEVVGRLVGGVAHDFNNILAVIIGSSDMLREDLPPGHPSQADVLEIRKAAERAAALTRQLLAFSRQQVLVPQVLDLSELVHNMVGMLNRILGDDITLTIRLAPAPAVVRADPGQLEQVLLNLAVNSRDAMPGGGQLVIETALLDLDASYTTWHKPMRPGPHVLLAVSDTGMGMNAETQARVFEPFFTTKEPGRGTGLGLSTVYGIVKQSEGFIWLYSEMGRGTSFKIYLPRIEGAVAPMEPAAHLPESLGGSETVLIAEDAPAVRLFARRALERHGYTILEASGLDAIDVAQAFQGTIHLLLTDVVMPGISGPDLAKTLSALRPDLRIIYMSGYTDATLRQKVDEAGGVFLQKPFAMIDLARKVREVLDLHE